MNTVRMVALVWTVALIAACALVVTVAGYASSIAPLALACLFCWQWLVATPRMLWARKS